MSITISKILCSAHGSDFSDLAAIRNQIPKSSTIARLLEEAEVVSAPDIFIPEVTNVFWKYYKLVDLPITTCEQGLENALELVDELTPSASLVTEVFAASCLASHPAYDLFYIVIARRLNGTLVTLDQKLLHCAAKLGVRTAETR